MSNVHLFISIYFCYNIYLPFFLFTRTLVFQSSYFLIHASLTRISLFSALHIQSIYNILIGLFKLYSPISEHVFFWIGIRVHILGTWQVSLPHVAKMIMDIQIMCCCFIKLVASLKVFFPTNRRRHHFLSLPSSSALPPQTLTRWCWTASRLRILLPTPPRSRCLSPIRNRSLNQSPSPSQTAEGNPHQIPVTIRKQVI